ncbi:competence type IV pilus major pilin ComGC [Virgibacillus oceani]|uniref:ComG operon protein 3 n=1 Tax=Virgibacillus oceani TaxID=1479511 RepID=A0A917H1F6_9BACI|nr:competence type IV pilus major pilin ComGC [Virgibacillus oceani]GGG63768.1 competence protein ComG [Virgibacillus oceani]
MFKNQKGFTLIEMLIVLLIISVLIILFVPNLSDKSDKVYSKGCDALVSVVQAQVDAYKLDKGNSPASLEVLKSAGYITGEQMSCPNKDSLTLKDDIVNVSTE